MDDNNLALLTDFYELTMANGYLESGLQDRTAYFDMFFRRVPDNGGFAIMAGVEKLTRYLKDLKFDSEDIEYLRSRRLFSERFLDYLKSFKFKCDVWAIPEGTPIFANEPLVTVRGPVIQAQFIETMVLLTINHQSLIATKANRIVRAAQGREVMEFGSRRAHGSEASVYGARAACIGGCAGTSCTLAGKEFDIPVMGTMAHSWVQMFPNELEAFRAYARTYPANSIFLVDTYNTLKSGVPNAIRTAREEIIPRGFRPRGIRIDSGDILELSRQARQMLDQAGLTDCKIVASSSLDEFIIRDLLAQGARIDSFGVGERLITSRSESVFGGVYKLVAVEENGIVIPKIKVSDQAAKTTNPGLKQVWRLYDKDSGQAVADVLTAQGEALEENRPYSLFELTDGCPARSFTNFRARRLQVRLFEEGRCVYQSPPVNEIQRYCRQQVETLSDEIKRFEDPARYPVGLSPNLREIKQKLLREYAV